MEDQQYNPPKETGHAAKPGFRPIFLAVLIACLGWLVSISIKSTDTAGHLPVLKESAHFPWEQEPAFFAAFGFIAYVVLVVIAACILRPLITRDEDYYE